MSPGGIGARERVAAVQALRPLRAVSVRVFHNGMRKIISIGTIIQLLILCIELTAGLFDTHFC